MGRRKITIRPITDPKLRHTTFNKRKNGLIKKAAELSMLCDLKLLLIFEDTSGSLIQYSTHNLFNQFEYFNNFMEDRTLQFSPKDYPNFFKVNHYKKNKVAEKEIEKEVVKLEKIRKQALAIPKTEGKSFFEVSPVVKKHECHADHLLEPAKTDSTMSLETTKIQTPDPQKATLRNPKKLIINIPEKERACNHTTTNTQMKSTSGFATIMPNSSIKLPSPQILRGMPSPTIKAPSPALLSKSSSKMPLGTKGLKPADTPGFFFNNDYFFNTSFDPTKNDAFNMESVNLNSSQIPQMVPANPMNNPMNSQLSASINQSNPLTNAQMAQISNSQFQAQMNGPLSAQMNGPLSAQMNAPIGAAGNNGVFKWQNYFELDSPYTTKLNQKFFYPFMNFNGPEEGFSPFLKNNMMLDLNTNSTLMKKDKSTFFTFKNEHNLGMGNKQEAMTGYTPSNDQNMNSNHYNREDANMDGLRPKKKQKV